ncbi:MAG: hypothetical protein ABIG73_02575 [Patescibacteria group bacterium]
MDNLLLINRVSAFVVWIIFWAFMLIIRLTKKNEFRAAFAGVKKMFSATVEMFIFFTVLNFVFWIDRAPIIKTVSIQWLFISSQLLGYILLLFGFVLAIWVAWSLQKPLLPAEPKYKLFKYLRNMMYAAVLLMAFGSSIICLNPVALGMSIALIPLILWRIKIENEANLNI